jgi:hypothetical protein
MKLLQNIKRPPKNTKLWPKSESGNSVVFMPYGPKGAGFYEIKETQ